MMLIFNKKEYILWIPQITLCLPVQFCFKKSKEYWYLFVNGEYWACIAQKVLQCMTQYPKSYQLSKH